MRIRTIKPEFFLHESLFEAERQSKLPLRVAFAGLWCAADREGRFKWEPRKLGVQILPYDAVDFSRVLDALITRGFICRYASGTGQFGLIPSFSRHQVINNRERESELPAPPENLETQDFDACGTREARDDDGNAELKRGREGKGKEGNKEHAAPPLLPFSSPEFSQAWEQWTKHRFELKKKLTPTAIAQQLAKMTEIGEERSIAMIEHSIANGWTGLFENSAKQEQPKRKYVPCC